MSSRTLSGATSEDVEALVFGFGIPPPHVIVALRVIWWRLRGQGVHLPTERRIIVHQQVRP